MDHLVQLARKVILGEMDILDCLGSLDKKVSLDHQASTVPLVLMDHQVFQVADQRVDLLALQAPEDFLDLRVLKAMMVLMEILDLLDQKVLWEDLVYRDFLDLRVCLDKRGRRGMQEWLVLQEAQD